TRGTGNVTFNLYNGNNTSGPSGAAINTHVNTLTNIISTSTPTAGVSYCGNPGLSFSSNIILPYSFNFSSPTTITGDFIMSVVVPTTSNDTIAIMHNSGLNGQTNSTAWEKWSDNTWHTFDDASGWGANTSIAILPKIACVTGISDPNGISHNIAVFPNPSNGLFNFAVTMPKATDLQFTVINSIGQVVYSKTERNISNSIIGVDLSHLAKGIYHVSITDNNGDKSIQKIVIE
ncbi:MAG: T9SS type A sorting domain-containing protein, partial [Bacteroidia bacterium]